MLYVGGSEKAYRCACGANVFRKLAEHIYRCNSCRVLVCDEKADDGQIERFESTGRSFQQRVDHWMNICFPPAVSQDVEERNNRLIEEVIEFVQSRGYPKQYILRMVEHVYAKPPGDPAQEVGGVMVTLAVACTASGLDLQQCAETELERVYENIDRIRAKHAAKKLRSPLPGEIQNAPECV